MTMVVGMFDSLVEVQRAVADLIDAGYARNTISILVRDTHPDALGMRQDPDEAHPALSEARDAQSPVDVIKMAKVLAGGPLAAVLRQTPVEHPEGPVVGGLTAAGLGLTSARYFADAIRNGAVLVAVHCEDRYVRDTRDLLDVHATHPQDYYPPPKAESRSPLSAR